MDWVIVVWDLKLMDPYGSGVSAIVVEVMEEMTYHRKVMLICYSFIKSLIKILKILLLP